MKSKNPKTKLFLIAVVMFLMFSVLFSAIVYAQEAEKITLQKVADAITGKKAADAVASTKTKVETEGILGIYNKYKELIDFLLFTALFISIAMLGMKGWIEKGGGSAAKGMALVVGVTLGFAALKAGLSVSFLSAFAKNFVFFAMMLVIFFILRTEPFLGRYTGFGGTLLSAIFALIITYFLFSGFNLLLQKDVGTTGLLDPTLNKADVVYRGERLQGFYAVQKEREGTFPSQTPQQAAGGTAKVSAYISDSKVVISGAAITVKKDNVLVQSGVSNAEGFYEFISTIGNSLVIEATKKGYDVKSQKIVVKEKDDDNIVKIKIAAIEAKIKDLEKSKEKVSAVDWIISGIKKNPGKSLNIGIGTAAAILILILLLGRKKIFKKNVFEKKIGEKESNIIKDIEKTSDKKQKLMSENTRFAMILKRFSGSENAKDDAEKLKKIQILDEKLKGFKLDKETLNGLVSFVKKVIANKWDGAFIAKNFVYWEAGNKKLDTREINLLAMIVQRVLEKRLNVEQVESWTGGNRKIAEHAEKELIKVCDMIKKENERMRANIIKCMRFTQEDVIFIRNIPNFLNREEQKIGAIMQGVYQKMDLEKDRVLKMDKTQIKAFEQKVEDDIRKLNIKNSDKLKEIVMKYIEFYTELKKLEEVIKEEDKIVETEKKTLTEKSGAYSDNIYALAKEKRKIFEEETKLYQSLIDSKEFLKNVREVLKAYNEEWKKIEGEENAIKKADLDKLNRLIVVRKAEAFKGNSIIIGGRMVPREEWERMIGGKRESGMIIERIWRWHEKNQGVQTIAMELLLDRGFATPEGITQHINEVAAAVENVLNKKDKEIIKSEELKYSKGWVVSRIFKLSKKSSKNDEIAAAILNSIGLSYVLLRNELGDMTNFVEKVLVMRESEKNKGIDVLASRNAIFELHRKGLNNEQIAKRLIEIGYVKKGAAIKDIAAFVRRVLTRKKSVNEKDEFLANLKKEAGAQIFEDVLSMHKEGHSEDYIVRNIYHNVTSVSGTTAPDFKQVLDYVKRVINSRKK